MARGDVLNSYIAAEQMRQAREDRDRAAVASGNVDKNSSLYRHAKLNGWDMGPSVQPATPAQEQEQPRVSPISAFASDGEGRITRYNNDGTEETQYVDPVRQMFSQMGQMVERGKAEKQQKQRLDRGAIASGLVYTKQSRNGMMPEEIRKAMGAQLGIDVAGGNFDQNGNFIIYGNMPTQGGGTRFEPVAVLSPEMQYKALQDTGLGESLQQGLYDDILRRSGLTEQQLRDRGVYSPAEYASAKTAGRGMSYEDRVALEELKQSGRMEIEREKTARANSAELGRAALQNTKTGYQAAANVMRVLSNPQAVEALKASGFTDEDLAGWRELARRNFNGAAPSIRPSAQDTAQGGTAAMPAKPESRLDQLKLERARRNMNGER